MAGTRYINSYLKFANGVKSNYLRRDRYVEIMDEHAVREMVTHIPTPSTVSVDISPKISPESSPKSSPRQMLGSSPTKPTGMHLFDQLTARLEAMSVNDASETIEEAVQFRPK